MGIKSLETELCTACGVCVDDCPMDVLRFDDATGRAYIAYPDDCTVCYLCEIGCPEGIIIVDAAVPRKLYFPYG